MKFNKVELFILLFLIFFFPNCVLADDYLEYENTTFNTDTLASSVSSDFPFINARHAVVFDRTSKTTIYGKSENESCKMASTTKILTAIIVIENCDDLNKIVTVSRKAARNGWI